MYLVLIFLAIIITIIIIFLNESAKMDNKIKEYKSKGLELKGSFSFICCGGVEGLGMCKASIDVLNDRIIMHFTKEKSGQLLAEKDFELFKDDIISVDIQTEKNIKEQVSLGKLFVFGVLAFGMKKKDTTKVNEYVVFTFRNNDKDMSVILENENESVISEKLKFLFIERVIALRDSNNSSIEQCE